MQTKAHNPRSYDHLAEEFDFAATLSSTHAFFVRNLPTKRESALDVGCGGGSLAFELARLFDRVVAIDISGPMLELARRKRPAPNIDYRLGDANDLDVAGSFDAVVSRNALHYVDDLPETLLQLRSLLRPGGRLIVVDLVKGVLPAHLARVCRAIRDFPVNVLRFGLATARRAFRFRLSPEWSDHTRRYRPPTREEFRRIYTSVLPGAKFERIGPLLSVVWQASETV